MLRAFPLILAALALAGTAATATAGDYPAQGWLIGEFVVVQLDGVDPSEQWKVPYVFHSDDGLRNVQGSFAYNDDDPAYNTGSITILVPPSNLTRGHPGTATLWVQPWDEPNSQANAVTSAAGPAVATLHLP